MIVMPIAALLVTGIIQEAITAIGKPLSPFRSRRRPGSIPGQDSGAEEWVPAFAGTYAVQRGVV
jgi:hypothetical protein